MQWNILDEKFYNNQKNPELAFKTDKRIIYPYWILDISLDELKDNGKFYNSVEYIDEIKKD